MNEVQVAEQLRGSFIESVLLTMQEHGGNVSHTELDEFTGDKMTTVDALVALHHLGLVREPDSEGGELTPFGARTAELIRRSLLSGPRRADIVQRALLRWLTTVEPASAEEFAGTPEATDAGVAFTVEEIHNAAELLDQRGFIRTISTAEATWIRPEITADGRAALMSNVLISDYGRPNPATITYDYSSRVTFSDHATAGGVISGGHGNTQHITQTITTQQARDIAAATSELLGLMDDSPTEVPPRLRESLEQLQIAASEGKPAGALKDLTQKALAAAAAAAGTDLGHQVLAGIAHIAQVLS